MAQKYEYVYLREGVLPLFTGQCSVGILGGGGSRHASAPILIIMN